MKHYIDPATNEIYAFESDGSQDDLIDPAFLPISDDDLAVLRAPSLDQQLGTLTTSFEAYLDTVAQTYRYDTIHSACGWSGEFADASALKAWAAACWRMFGTIEEAIQGGTRQIPTYDALIAELPALVI